MDKTIRIGNDRMKYMSQDRIGRKSPLNRMPSGTKPRTKPNLVFLSAHGCMS
jgi:hypothetical protein